MGDWGRWVGGNCWTSERTTRRNTKANKGTTTKDTHDGRRRDKLGWKLSVYDCGGGGGPLVDGPLWFCRPFWGARPDPLDVFECCC